METIRIRKGGVLTPDGFLFEITGGALALDLANTVDVRKTAEPKELIPSYAELVRWSRQAGALPPSAMEGLIRRGEAEPEAAEEVRQRALELRETLFSLFSSVALGRAPEELEGLNRWIAEAFPRLELAPEGGRFAWSWRIEEPGLDRMLWPVVRSAAELLASEEISRVRLCAGDICGWLFLDRSRQGNRQWCDMTVCGNRAKARRHYLRSRG